MKTLHLLLAAIALAAFQPVTFADHKTTKVCLSCCKKASKCDACCGDKGTGKECRECCGGPPPKKK